MTTPTIPWIHGIPTAATVATHAAEHPVGVRIRGHRGGAWLVLADYLFGPCPQILMLRVGQPGEEVDTGDSRHPRHTYTEATLLLANGLAFWQPLAPCRWAPASRYLPCTPEGIPVCLLPHAPTTEPT